MRFVTRVAASLDAFFAVDFVAAFGVTFLSATLLTSLEFRAPAGHRHRKY